MQISTKNIFLFIILFVSVSYSQIYVSLPDTSIEKTKSITIPIYVSDLTGNGIYSYEFRLKYDKNILKPKSIIDDGTLSDRRSWDINAYIDKQGLIVNARGWYWLSGGGVLLYVKFDILTDEGNCDLTLDPFEFNNGNPSPKIINGKFEVYVKKNISFAASGNGNGTIRIDDESYNLPVELNLKNGKNYTIQALPNESSSFIRWDGDLNSNSNPIDYKISNDAKIIANFAKKALTISATLEPKDYGYVEGTGIYNYGEVATLTAKPYSGKKFSSWKIDGNTVSNNPVYQFTVNKNLDIVASFENLLVQITASANPIEAGFVTGSGYYFPNDTAIVKASSSKNWKFFNWTENDNILSDDSIFTFMVTVDKTLKANYTLVTSIVDDNINLFDNFFISPPYPNPFNPITNFRFGLANNAIVNLYIMDIKGTIVKKMINSKPMNKGIFENQLDGNNLSSGVYFFYFEAVSTLEGKRYFETGKLILLK
ncbi:MAG: cohesin domain-containing protein [Melioribacteraceae bacterium]|nr:cohesin domain-containing protein [Melioribacteraceae bacterium]